MIQRIQTVWLVSLALLSIILISGGIIQFNPGDGSVITLGFSGLIRETGANTEVLSDFIGVPLTLVFLPALAIVAIFLYKKIKLQKTITLFVIVLSVCLLVISAFYWHFVSHRFGAFPIPGYRIALPPVMVVLAIMAYRGIIKDSRLLKSYHRIR